MKLKFVISIDKILINIDCEEGNLVSVYEISQMVGEVVGSFKSIAFFFVVPHRGMGIDFSETTTIKEHFYVFTTPLNLKIVVKRIETIFTNIFRILLLCSDVTMLLTYSLSIYANNKKNMFTCNVTYISFM